MGAQATILRIECSRAVLAGVIGLLLACSSTAQQVKTCADFFPDSTVAFVQVNQPDQLIDKLVTHPLVKSVSEWKQIKTAIASPQFAMAIMAKGMIESQINEPLLEAAKSSVAGGLAIGIDPETDGVAIMFRAADEAKLKRLAGAVLRVAASGAKQQGNDIPFEKTKYRDAVAAKFDGFLIARYQTWFLISNKPQLAKSIVDNLIDGAESPLADQDWFQTAQSSQSDSDAWVAVHLEAIRSAGVAPELFQGRTDNPGAELILGGLFDALQHAPIATGQLSLNQHLDVSLEIPFDANWASGARRFFFGRQMDGVAPAALIPENLIANLVSYRDISDWWLSKEDLFEEAVIAGLAQADSQLSTIFSGMDFGEDVLGALQPGVQIVVSENTFVDPYVPDVKLPSFALVGKLKDPDKIRRKLKIAFQSVIGFANINLGMQGQPQLDLETERISDGSIFAAQYFYEDDVEEGLLLFNFSPTIAFQGPYLIVSSTRDLAVELARVASQRDPSQSEESQTNTRLEIEGNGLSRILNLNAESLLASNMLEKGNTRKQAEVEISYLLAAVKLLKDAQLDFRVEPERMRLKLQVRVNEQDPTTK